MDILNYEDLETSTPDPLCDVNDVFNYAYFLIYDIINIKH